MSKLYQIHQIIGGNFDATIYTNGGTYHKVIVENIVDGSHKVRKFHNRAKAFKFAEAEAE